MKYFLFLTLSFFITTDCFSNTVVSICAGSQVEMKKAYKNAQFIKANNDVLKVDGTCFDVLTNESRETLYVKYLRNKTPYLDIKSTSPSFSKRSCHLILTRTSKKNSQVKIAGNNKSQVYLSETSNDGLNYEKSHFVVQENRNGLIRFNQEILNLKCQIQKHQYHIELWSTSPHFNISSSIMVKMGKKIQIGTYQQNNNTNNRNVQIIKNSFKSKEETKLITLYLEVQAGKSN
ncbi:MAG: hypothetical protein ACJAS4_000334 [Bacteriovoracaceae bacterium]|jgi:hypothetical protein